MSESDQPGLSAEALIDQMFTLWIVPHSAASNLDVTRDQVVQALVVLHPNGAPEVKLNEQAELLATVQVRDAVASGEPVTAENVEHVSRSSFPTTCILRTRSPRGSRSPWHPHTVSA